MRTARARVSSSNFPSAPMAPVSLLDRSLSHTQGDSAAVKTRLGAGYCLRAPAQGACPYANICEHCPSFHTDAAYLPVLAAQRADAQALAVDADARGWADEADRHRRLIARLDALLAAPPGA